MTGNTPHTRLFLPHFAIKYPKKMKIVNCFSVIRCFIWNTRIQNWLSEKCLNILFIALVRIYICSKLMSKCLISVICIVLHTFLIIFYIFFVRRMKFRTNRRLCFTNSQMLFANTFKITIIFFILFFTNLI